jgi:hypothetical protein
VLKEMNEKNKRKVPEDAPISFVKPRWRDHVVSAEGELDRRYYELSALPDRWHEVPDIVKALPFAFCEHRYE